jgi:hypothetical protein
VAVRSIVAHVEILVGINQRDDHLAKRAIRVLPYDDDGRAVQVVSRLGGDESPFVIGPALCRPFCFG